MQSTDLQLWQFQHSSSNVQSHSLIFQRIKLEPQRDEESIQTHTNNQIQNKPGNRAPELKLFPFSGVCFRVDQFLSLMMVEASLLIHQVIFSLCITKSNTGSAPQNNVRSICLDVLLVILVFLYGGLFRGIFFSGSTGRVQHHKMLWKEAQPRNTDDSFVLITTPVEVTSWHVSFQVVKESS